MMTTLFFVSLAFYFAITSKTYWHYLTTKRDSFGESVIVFVFCLFWPAVVVQALIIKLRQWIDGGCK